MLLVSYRSQLSYEFGHVRSPSGLQTSMISPTQTVVVNNGRSPLGLAVIQKRVHRSNASRDELHLLNFPLCSGPLQGQRSQAFWSLQHATDARRWRVFDRCHAVAGTPGRWWQPGGQSWTGRATTRSSRTGERADKVVWKTVSRGVYNGTRPFRAMHTFCLGPLVTASVLASLLNTWREGLGVFGWNF